MGAGCSKACTSSHTVEGFTGASRATRINVKAQTSHQDSENPFSISIDCFSVPSGRILPHPTALLGPGAGCRSVVVTTIYIERLEQRTFNKRASNLNSAIYTPVIQWFGVDVKQQVPQYLPMNLWPGTYTVFGFYNPEDSGSTRVKLTAKVGSHELTLSEHMDTERCLSNEKWSNIARLMTNELKKLDTPVKRSSFVRNKETGSDAADSSKVKEKAVEQRISQDTGYMSTAKRSLDQSPYSMKYITYTSDGEETASLKGKQSCEIKLKLRRKDTPAHGLYPARLSPHSLDIRDSPLEEESESFLLSGLETSASEHREAIPVRPVSALAKCSEQTYNEYSPQLLSDKCALALSKSTGDLRDIEHSSLLPILTNSDDREDRKMRKKKRSVISKIGSLSPKAEAELCKDQEDKEIYKGADADDEADFSLAENASLTRGDSFKCITTELDGDENNKKFIPEVTKSSDEDVQDYPTYEEQFEKVTDMNANPDAIAMLSVASDGVESSSEHDAESRMSMTRSDNFYCQENERTIDNEPILSIERVNAEKDEKKHENSGKEFSKQEEMEVAGKNIPDEFDLAGTRPRSRTLSKSKRNTYDDKHFKKRSDRTSKSICIPPRNINHGDIKNVSSFPTQALDKASVKTKERPFKSRQAFSDS